MSAAAPFRYEFGLRLELESPFATRGLSLNRATIDTPLARTSGHYMVPGTLVQGVVRAALHTLAEHTAGQAISGGGSTAIVADDLRNLFGERSGKNSAKSGQASHEGWHADNEPDRGGVSFGDLIIEPAAETRADRFGEITRIALDEETGAAREGFLQVIELPFPLGEAVAFQGTVHLRAGRIAPERFRFLLQRALGLVPALGGMKSVGFGRLRKYAIAPHSGIAPIGKKLASGRHVTVEFSLDRPFVVDAAVVGDNSFRGSDLIPGGVLKGALANALADAATLHPAMQECLSRLSFSHAFPRPDSGTASPRRAVPLCLAVSGDRVYDRLLASDNQTAMRDGQPARLAFAPDLKDDAQDLLDFFCDQAWSGPAHEVRTRTKIDPAKGSAVDEQLFSYRAVVPDGFRWRSTVGIPGGVPESLADDALSYLAAGLGMIGKTAAVMRDVTVENGVAPTPRSVQPGKPAYALVLETPALLNSLAALRRGVPAAEDYARYFAERGYKLQRHFARQRIVGGYLALRYPQRRDGYEVFVVTEPGSVFLVEPVAPAQSTHDVADLLAWGLPPDVPVELLHWKRCPFLPQNGFGHVRCHVVDAEAGLPAGKQVRRKAS